MTGLLSKLLRVSDKASLADTFSFWAATTVILGIMFIGQIAFIASAIWGAK